MFFRGEVYPDFPVFKAGHQYFPVFKAGHQYFLLFSALAMSAPKRRNNDQRVSAQPSACVAPAAGILLADVGR
jgi:hypothetical protein